MTIGIDASRANHNQKTGVEWYAYHLIQEFKNEIPANISVVLYTDKPLQGDLAILPDNWTQKVLKWPPRRLWTQIRLSIEMILNPPDVLFVPAHVAPLIHPKQTVVTIHDVAAHAFPQTYNWFERWYSLWSAKHAVRSQATIIAPSQFTKTEIQKMTNSSYQNITVIPNGYNKQCSQIDNPELINQTLQTYSITKPFLLSIGRLEEKKNTKRMVESFTLLKQSHPNLQLVLIGKPGHGYEQVAEAITNSPYKQDIIEPGWVENHHLPALMNAASVFVFPSIYEGFGIPVLEALSCGTPVITATGSALEEVGGKAATYVDPQNTQAIATAIEDILTNPETAIEKQSIGLKYVANFSWKRTAQKTAQLIVEAQKS